MAWGLLRASAGLFLGLILAASANARTLHVPSQYPTIASGLVASAAGDTVLVACGTYSERALIMKSGVTLRSEAGTPACVTIDAGGVGRVLSCSAVAASTRIEGLTLRNGHVTGAGQFFWGGGLLCEDDSAPQLLDCAFEDNLQEHGFDGGGGGLAIVDSAPHLTNCSFSRNQVVPSPEQTNTSGGGVFCLRSVVAFEHCSFVDNASGGGGGGLFAWASSVQLISCTFQGDSAYASGGGATLMASDATIGDCAFLGNASAEGVGGGLASTWSSSVSMTACIFSSNEAVIGGGLGCNSNGTLSVRDVRFESNAAQTSGGGCYVDGSAQFEYCVFVGNGAGYGGGVSVGEPPGEPWSTPSFMHCTFASNTAISYGSGCTVGNAQPAFIGCTFAFHSAPSVFRCFFGSPSLQCCDLYGNVGGDWTDVCIADQAGITDNFSADPLFCDAETGDYHLDRGSPCLPGASPGQCGLVGALGQGCGPIATQPETWGRLKGLFR